MATILDVIVIGLQDGAIFALVALGLALVYKATRVLNFAHGGIGATGAFVAYVFLVDGDIAGGVLVPGRLWWATLIAVAVGGVLGVIANVVVRRLRETAGVTALVATVAMALLLLGVQTTVFGIRIRNFPRFLEGAPCLASRAGECVRPLTIGTIIVSWHTLIIFGVLAVAALLLTLLFRSRVGTALLATAQNPFAAELQGVPVGVMTAVAWGTAGALAAVAGVLGAGVFTQIFPGFMLGTFLIPGFVAALLGGMTSMVGAGLGGLLVGITFAAANQTVQALDLSMPGPPHAAVLIIILAVLLLRPQGLLGRQA